MVPEEDEQASEPKRRPPKRAATSRGKLDELEAELEEWAAVEEQEHHDQYKDANGIPTAPKNMVAARKRPDAAMWEEARRKEEQSCDVFVAMCSTCIRYKEDEENED